LKSYTKNKIIINEKNKSENFNILEALGNKLESELEDELESEFKSFALL
jgi:hypothetical protein